MFSKRGNETACETSPSKKLARRLKDLALGHQLSFQEVRSLFQDASEAGCAGCKEMALPRSSEKNTARDFKRAARKGCQWPKCYYADVRFWNVKKQTIDTKPIPFLLPHEILAGFASHLPNKDKLFETAGLDYDGQAHLKHVLSETGLKKLCCMGLWGDGVPVNYDRTESFEAYCLSFPGFVGKNRNIRIPLTGVMKKHMVTRATVDDIFAVIAWSFQCCYLGSHPCKRHDGKEWLPSDAHRRRRNGVSLGAQSILMEVRGDWCFYKSVFSFPGWQEKGNCCWRCPAKLSDIKDASSSAVWRKHRYSHWDLLAILQQKNHVSTLFACPHLKCGCFRVDWLHCVDLGVAADFLGNLFRALLIHMPGNSMAERCQQLFREILAWYKAQKCVSRLDQLTLTMIQKQSSKPPKLRAKAAEARALIPFGLDAAERWLVEPTPVNQAIRVAAKSLAECYSHLAPEVYDPAKLRMACRTFCLQYSALEAYHNHTCYWKIKPKFHLFQEMCEMSRSCPSSSWTYRDEDFGGTVALYVKRRGGACSVNVSAQSLLDRFVAMHPVFFLLD